ncbi:hypothetical protein ACVWYF_002988 [Hymenobacter sp. UYAg731]
MARSGGAGNFSGVDYQLLFTATRLAEALVSDAVISAHPEVHDLLPHPGLNAETFSGLKPAVDDLVVLRRQQPPTHYSLKYQASQPHWDVGHLKSRQVLADFYQQHQQNPTASIVLVSQSPPARELQDCLDRVQGATPQTLLHLLESTAAQKAYASIETFLADTFSCSTVEVIAFLQRISFLHRPAELLELELNYLLGPLVANVALVMDALKGLALHYGRIQQPLTAQLLADELARRDIYLIAPPNAVEVQQQLDRLATMLTSAPASLRRDGIHHHIIRPEVLAMVDWVQSPVKPVTSADDNTVGVTPRNRSKIVVGGAGVGKTVVMRDIYYELRRRHIPVLALKADRLRTASKGELLERIQQEGLAHPLFQALTVLSSPSQPAVVLVDQLDALSLCLSTDRSPLRSYAELLTELSILPNVRFIMACRSFDLQYDPDLSQFNSAERVEIPLLNDQQIIEALQAFASTETAASLPVLLRELLRTPLYLELYTSLEPEDRGDSPITTAQELFRRFLNQKILRDLPTHLTREQVESSLNRLAVDLQRLQTLALPARPYEEEDSGAIEWLASRGVLLKLPGRPQMLQFFHQSFFDFIFARQFVRGKQSLTKLILNSDQGLFFRATVRQVLVYLRGTNPLAYEETLRDLLTSTIRFHIRLLVVQHLATVSDPTQQEKQVVATCVLPSPQLCAPFLESAIVRAWQEWLCEPPIFDSLVPELPGLDASSSAHKLFHNLTYQAPDLCLRQLATMPESEHKAPWVANTLFRIQNCADPLLPQLFDQYVAGRKAEWDYAFWSGLDKATRAYPDWVAGHMISCLGGEVSAPVSQHARSILRKIVEALYTCAPATALAMCAQLFTAWLNQEAKQYRVPRKHLIHSSLNFMHFDPNGSKSSNIRERVYENTRDFLRSSAATLSPSQQLLIEQWLCSRQSILIQLGLEAVVAASLLFQPAFIQLLTQPSWLHAAAGTPQILYLVQTILFKTWDGLDIIHQKLLAEAFLAALRPVSYFKKDRARYPFTVYGIGRYGQETYGYLGAITSAQLAAFPKLQRLHAELHRRYGPLLISKPEAPIRMRSGERSPAYSWKTTRVSTKQWLQSLRRYRAVDENESFFSDKGTYRGLVSQLGELIKGDPQEYLPLLQELLAANDESVISLLSNLQEAAPDLAVPLIEQAYNQGLLSTDSSQTTWLLRAVRDAHNEQPAFVVRHHLAVLRAHLVDDRAIEEVNQIRISSINTTGGAAVYALLQGRFSSILYPEVLATLQAVITTGSWTVRAAALQYVAMLLNVADGPGDVVGLFCGLVGKDYRLLEAGTWSLNYLLWRDLPRILQLLTAALTEPDMHETIVHYATVAWMHNEAGAQDLLEQVWTLSPNTRASSLKLLAEHFKKPAERPRFFELCERFLLGANDELRQAYDWCFTCLTILDFDPLMPKLAGYFQAFGYDLESDHFLIEYLATCVRQRPVQCIEALKQLFACLDPQRFYHSTEESLQLLLEAYTVLPTGEPGAVARGQALDLLDQLLLRADYRPQVRALVELSDRMI